MKNVAHSFLTRRAHVFWFVFSACILSIVIGYAYYRYEYGKEAQRISAHIESVAREKTGQIIRWREERFADARVIVKSAMFQRAVDEYVRTRSSRLGEEIKERLLLPLKEYGYSDILLLSSNGSVLLSLTQKYRDGEKDDAALLDRNLFKNKVYSPGLRYYPLRDEIHYDVIAPMHSTSGAVTAVLVFRSNPALQLYPMLLKWPTESRTSEALLVMRDGDSVLYLNELRMQKNTAFKFRIPLTRTDLPAVQAVLGSQGLFEGKDYRGVDVFAYLLPVPGTPWHLVAKIDGDEALAGFREHIFTASLMIFSIFLLLSFIIYRIYSRKQQHEIRQLFIAEKNLSRLLNQHRITLESIGDAVISTDATGRIRFLNPVAESLTGWKAAEAIDKPLTEVFVIINEESRATVESPVIKVLREGVVVGLANHTLLISRDGREIPIADSGAPVRDPDGAITGVVLVFRDQTEERLTRKLIEARVAILEFAAEYPFQEMLVKALDEVELLTGSVVSFFHTVGPDESSVTLQAWSSHTSRQYCSVDLFEQHYPLERAGVWADCVRERKVIIHNDYPNLPNKRGMPKGHAILQRELVVPVFKNGAIVAILGVGNKKTVYTERDENIVTYLANVIWDAAEWKKAEKEKIFLANTVDISVNEIYIFDAATLLFIYVNEGARKNLGYTMEEMRALTPLDLKPDFTADSFAALTAPLQNGQAPLVIFQTRHRRKDGSLYPVEVHLQLEQYQDNPRYLAIILDISERVAADAEKEAALSALTESEENYRHLFDSGSDAILVVECVTSQILRANDAASALYGYEKAELLAMKKTDLSAEPEKTGQFTSVIPHTELQQVTIPLRWHRKKDGTVFPVEISSRFFTLKGRDVHIAAIRDISARLKTEQALRKSEHRFRLLFTEMETGFALHEVLFNEKGDAVDYRFLEINPAFEELTGLNAKQTAGKTVREVFPNIDPVWIERYARVAVTGIPERFEDYFAELDRYYEIRAFSPEKNKFAVLFSDVSSRVKTQRELNESEKRYRNIFDTTNEGICTADADDNITMANPRLSLMLGYSVDELRQMNFSQLVAPADKGVYRKQNEKRRAGNSGVYELRLNRKDGAEIWMRVSATPVYGENGGFSGALAMFSNITAHKKAEEQVRKLQRGMEQSPVSVVITGRDGAIEYVNKKFCDLTGYSPEEALGKNPRILKSGETPPEVYQNLWDTILAGNEWSGELHNRKKNGELFWESAIIAPVKDESGAIAHFIALKEDVTEKKRMLDELIAAKDKAEEMNRIKSAFFAQMSHELRTPLIGILGYSEVLEDEFRERPDVCHMAETINKSGKRLLTTLNMILELSHLESNKVPVNLCDEDVIPLLREVCDLYASIAAARNLTLQFATRERSLTCRIDHTLFHHVFNNLVNNAVKYTDEGGIIVKVVRDGNVAVFSVTDTGIGIPEDKLQVIWDDFRQASEGLSRSFEGTGLGLSIAKKYTELLGGTISVESTFGSGSVFTVMLPVSDADIQPPASDEVDALAFSKQIPPLSAPKHNILYVEDDDIVSEIVKDVGRGYFEIDVARDAVTAYHKVTVRRYDAILMDINLRRGLDGVQLTQIIRVLPGYDSIPIIAITAYAMVGDKEEFLSKGMTHYISKPFRRKDLFDLLCAALHVAE